MERETLRRCSRCVLSERFPGVSFDDDGICNYCREAGPAADMESRRIAQRAQLDRAIAESRADGAYQCIVAFSGGKDSSFALKLLTQHYGLRCLAVTVDNGFLSEQAFINCRLVTDALGVDHEFHRPAGGFMRRLYKESLAGGMHVASAAQRASAICNSCIGFINTHMLKTAVRLNVPLIAGGYLGGQLPRNAGVMSFSLKTLLAARQRSEAVYAERLGPEFRHRMSLSEPDSQAPTDRKLTIINPMLAWPTPEDEIIAELGPLGWKRPDDTGLNSSNCRLNDLGVLLHWREHGFHPYESELAELVRIGSMDRDEALAKLAPLPTVDQVSEAAAKLAVQL